MKNIILLGASFNTGNLGVSALTDSLIKLLLSRWPKAEIFILGADRHAGRTTIRTEQRTLSIQNLPIRYCANITTPNHILKLAFFLAGKRVFSFSSKRRDRDETLTALLNADIVCDITGGDSFSDLYGFSRFFRGYLAKRLCLMTGKPFLLLPQTYGPYKYRLSRWLTRKILARATAVYARDLYSLQEVRNLMKKKPMRAAAQFCPDVAFVLDPRRPDTEQMKSIEKQKHDGRPLIGMNINGLLYHGGYTRKNMFQLKIDYPSMTRNMAREILQHTDSVILLVPHVFPSVNSMVESDLAACRDVYEKLCDHFPGRLLCLDDCYNQNEIKHIIGHCDFFIGSRMHSCIAALSQQIPAVGIAYSNKFIGVFESVGVADCVLNANQLEEQRLIQLTMDLLFRKDILRKTLVQTIPHAKAQVYRLFNQAVQETNED